MKTKPSYFMSLEEALTSGKIATEIYFVVADSELYAWPSYFIVSRQSVSRQSVSQSVSRSVTESVSQSVSQSISQSVGH